MNKLISGIVIDESESLNLDEFCHATHVKKEMVIQMIEYQLIEPHGQSPQEWRFNSHSLKRGRMAASFYQDLEINMQGIAVVLQLLEEIEALEHEIHILEKK